MPSNAPLRPPVCLKPKGCTGHSLRTGHITQASMERAPGAAIQAQSRHESDRAFQEARPAAKTAGEYTERASEAVD